MDEDKDQVPAATYARSQTSMHLSPRLTTACPQCATHIHRLQLVATRSERAIHLWPTLYLIVSRSQCLGDGVEDLLVQRQYVVAELFPSLTDMEDEDDGVEFYWRDEDGG